MRSSSVSVISAVVAFAIAIAVVLFSSADCQAGGFSVRGVQVQQFVVPAQVQVVQPVVQSFAVQSFAVQQQPVVVQQNVRAFRQPVVVQQSFQQSFRQRPVFAQQSFQQPVVVQQQPVLIQQQPSVVIQNNNFRRGFGFGFGFGRFGGLGFGGFRNNQVNVAVFR